MDPFLNLPLPQLQILMVKEIENQARKDRILKTLHILILKYVRELVEV
jgi:hypothetical protein